MLKKRNVREIAGRHHPLVKAVRQRARAGELLAEGEVLLETPKLAEEALASGATLSRVLVRQGASAQARSLLQKLPPETLVYETEARLFDALGTVEHSQGILALAAAPRWREEDLFPAGRSPLILVLAGLQDPGNLGAILRTAEAFGATGILLARGTVSQYNAKAVRASAGTLFRLPILGNLTAAAATALLRRHRTPLLVSVVAAGKPFSKADLAGPFAIALGSEGAGVPPEWATAGELLTIPMSQRVQSLNVAAAAAVILYEAARQRNAGKLRTKPARDQ